MRRFMACLPALLILTACASTDKDIQSDLPPHWRLADGDVRATIEPTPTPQWTQTERVAERRDPTSLWSGGPGSLFGDRRASQVGDLLTVVVEINDEAEIRNSVQSSRQTEQELGVSALFGLPEIINRNLPDGASLDPAIDLERTRSIAGNGDIRREEEITLRLAARIIDVLPNGHLRLVGRQEIMVNQEVRFLAVSGIIRAQDISRLNVITYDKMAEAEIFYGGRGQISEAVRSRIGNRAFDRLIPF